jgi:hypothetical protein
MLESTDGTSNAIDILGTALEFFGVSSEVIIPEEEVGPNEGLFLYNKYKTRMLRVLEDNGLVLHNYIDETNMVLYTKLIVELIEDQTKISDIDFETGSLVKEVIEAYEYDISMLEYLEESYVDFEDLLMFLMPVPQDDSFANLNKIRDFIITAGLEPNDIISSIQPHRVTTASISELAPYLGRIDVDTMVYVTILKNMSADAGFGMFELLFTEEKAMQIMDSFSARYRSMIDLIIGEFDE